MWKRLCVVVCAVILNACGGGSGSDASDNTNANSAPEFSEIYTDISHFHPSFWEKWDMTNVGLIFTLNFQVHDPQGVQSIRFLEAANTRNGNDWYWTILDQKTTNTEFNQLYNVNSDEFSVRFHNGINPERIELTNWQIYAENAQGLSSISQFEFFKPNREPIHTEQYVYSSSYTSPDINGIQAMEAMTIADNDISFISYPESQSFSINFTHSDERARNYILYFYSGAPEYRYIGRKDSNSLNTIMPSLVYGLETEIQLSWSDLNMDSGYQPQDIAGIHIVLLDEYLEKSFPEGEKWASYLGYSEYVPVVTLN